MYQQQKTNKLGFGERKKGHKRVTISKQNKTNPKS